MEEKKRLTKKMLEEQLLNARVIIERNVGVVNFLNSILDKFNFNDEEDKTTELK